MSKFLYPGWTQRGDTNRRDEMECPNCGGRDTQTDDDGHRICWECGTRWST
jgi:phage/plasmid primase-like uncharacterized protein